MSYMDEEGDRAIALELQRTYDNEQTQREVAAMYRQPDSIPPSSQTTQSVAMKLISSMRAMPYSDSRPNSSRISALDYRGDAVRSKRIDPNSLVFSETSPSYSPTSSTPTGLTPTQIETNRRSSSIFRKDR